LGVRVPPALRFTRGGSLLRAPAEHLGGTDYPPTDQPTDQVSHVTTTPVQKRRTGGVRLFLRQVVAELKKVVRPTRTELITYTSVVMVFVLAVMVYVSALDFGFGKLVLWAFGGS
jgi:preprotein translocase subunit SecE